MHAFLKISLHPRSGATVGTLRPRGFRALNVVDVSTKRARGAKSYGRARYEKDQDEGTAKNKECKYKVDWGGLGWVVHIRWATYNARTLRALEAPQAMPRTEGKIPKTRPLNTFS